MPPPKILWLVEDEPRYRVPFERLILTTDEFVLDRSFACFEDLLATRRVGVPWPDLVVMDLHLPGTDGIDGTRLLAAQELPVVVLTTSDDPPTVYRALEAGASGYVVKGTDPERMFTALREASEGGTYFSPSVARHVLRRIAGARPPTEPLSPREVEVLRELAEGRSKARIAEALCISPHTVDTHLREVYRKLRVKTAAAAAAAGVRSGLI
ncbi:MAG: response regulator transcription factor [Bacteroidota bacterium]